MLNQRKAVLLIGVSAFCFGINGPLVKLSSWDPLAVTWLRAVLTLVGVMLWLRMRKDYRMTFGRREALAGILVGLCNLCFIVACFNTAVANVYVMFATAPCFSLLFDCWSEKRAPRIGELALLVLVTGGVVILESQSVSFGTWRGDLIALVAAVLWSWHLKLVEGSKRPGGATTVALIGQIMLVLILAWRVTSVSMPGVIQLSYLLLVGISTTFGVILWAVAIQAKVVPGFRANLELVAVEVLIATLSAWVLLGESLTSWTLIGGALILGGTLRLIIIRAK